MDLDENTKAHIELLIIKKNKEQDEITEKIYIKRADFGELFYKILNKDPYYRAVKWFIAGILMAFGSTIIGLGFTMYKLING